jgi:hypothetical protein
MNRKELMPLEHELAIVRAFIAPSRRPRWEEMLREPKRRRAWLDRLNHCRDLDSRRATPMDPHDDVADLLRRCGAPEQAYLLASDDKLDGQLLELEAAIQAAHRSGWGTIISCVPGRLACFYDELGDRRLLLTHPGPG